jgi:hypothetical protein
MPRHATATSENARANFFARAKCECVHINVNVAKIFLPARAKIFSPALAKIFLLARAKILLEHARIKYFSNTSELARRWSKI